MPITMTERKRIGPYVIYERTPKPRGQTKYVVGEDGKADLVPYGKYSTAIRHCKQRMPRPIPHAVVNMEDKSVVSTLPVDYTIIDGEYINSASAKVNPARVEKLLEGHGVKLTNENGSADNPRGGRAEER